MKRHARTLLGLLLAAGGVFGAIPSNAQQARPLSLIVAYPPGGTSDSTARLLAERLSPKLGRSIVVENRAGADGIIAMQALARAQPDGSIIGFAAVSPLSITPHVQKLPFALDAVAPLTPVMYSPAVLVATSALKAKTLPELVAKAKADPGAVRAANSGALTLSTLILHELQKTAHIEITVVPYKGGGQLLNDAIGGQFELMVMNISATVVQSINEGKLTALAVTGAGRSASLPNVPTLTEAGYPTADMISSFGLFVPAHMPQQTMDTLSKAVNEVIADPEFKARLADMGNVATGGSPAEFANLIQQDSTRNARILKDAGMSRQ